VSVRALPRIENGIAVSDEDLDEQRMDILYSVRAAGKRVLIYVLAEHQSGSEGSRRRRS
jgi:hypothetical protein